MLMALRSVFAALALLLASLTFVQGLSLASTRTPVQRRAGLCFTATGPTVRLARRPAWSSSTRLWDAQGDADALEESSQEDDQDEVEPPTSEASSSASALPPPPSSPRVVSSASSSQSSLSGLTRDQKRLDPLVASLTRMDDDTLNAPRTNVPLWGELILDRSLLVLLPVATFAVVGFFLSVYVGVNAQDDFVNALVETARQQSSQLPAGLPPPAGGVVADEAACRGLCSNQEQDLQSLKAFMESLRQK